MRRERPSRLPDGLRGAGYVIGLGAALFAVAAAVAALLVWAMT